MSKSETKEKLTARTTGDVDVAAGRAHTQAGWYELASSLFAGREVLDVGCGLGLGIGILERTAASVTGQELDERLAKPNVRIGSIESFEDGSFECITSVEVIEHIVEVQEFVAHLFRVSRSEVFLTTPNWTASRCQWPYHVKEFTPRELVDLVSPYGEVTLYMGNPSGAEHYRIKHLRRYFLLNDLMTWRSTCWFMKYVHKLLPYGCKIGSNIAVHVKKTVSDRDH